MLKRGAASAQDPGARGAEPGPRSGSRTCGGGRGGVCGGGLGGGARAGPGRAGPRRGAGPGGPSVTHAAVREAATAAAADAAGTGTGARARAGAGCLLPPSSLSRSLSGPLASRPGAELATAFSGRKKWGAEDADKFQQYRGSGPRRWLRFRRGRSALRGGAHGQSVRGGGRPGL